MEQANFEGKSALITGGGSGINLELVKALHLQGCAVLIADIALRPEAAQWLETAQSKSDPKILFRKLDVTNWDAIDAAFDFFEDEFVTAPDIIVAGAGIYEASSAGFWDDEDESSHYKLFDINLSHPIKITRIAVRRLKRARKPGVVLHISSITAQKPSVVLPLYSVSKAAISQFVRCMAQLDDLCGVRVVAVAPGVVDTPLFRDSVKAMTHIDLDKDFVLTPAEIVRSMIALLTDSKYKSGTVLEVGDVDSWREVQLLNDSGPAGRSTLPRAKAGTAIALVHEALKKDQASVRGGK